MSENNNPEILLNGDFSQLVEINAGNSVPTLWVGEDGEELSPSDWNQTKMNSNIMQRKESDGTLLIRDRFSPNAGNPLEKETQYSIVITPTANHVNKAVGIRFRRKGNTKNCKITWNTIDGNDVNSSTFNPQKVKTSATFTTLADYNGNPDTIEIGFVSKWVKLDTISLKKVAEPVEPGCNEPAQQISVCGISPDVLYYNDTPTDVNGVYTLDGSLHLNKPRWKMYNDSARVEWYSDTDYTGWHIAWYGTVTGGHGPKVTGLENAIDCPYGDDVSTSHGGSIVSGNSCDSVPETPAPDPCSNVIDDSVFDCATLGYPTHVISVDGQLLEDSSEGGGAYLELRGGAVNPSGTMNLVNGKPWWAVSEQVGHGLQITWNLSQCKWHLTNGGDVDIYGIMPNGNCPWDWSWPEGVEVMDGPPPSSSPVPSPTPTPLHEECGVDSIHVCNHPAGLEWSGVYTKTGTMINGRSLYSNTSQYSDSDHFISYGDEGAIGGPYWGFAGASTPGIPLFPFQAGRADMGGGTCPTEQTWTSFVTGANGQIATNHALKVSSNAEDCPTAYINIESIVVDENQLVTITVDFGGSDVDHWHYEVDGFIDETMVMSGNSVSIYPGVGQGFTLNVYATNNTGGETHPHLASASQTFDVMDVVVTPTPTSKVVYESCGGVPCVVTSPLETPEAGAYEIYGQGAGSRESWTNGQSGDNRRIIYWKTDLIGDKWVMGKSPTNVLYEMDSSYNDSGGTYCPWDVDWEGEHIQEVTRCPDAPDVTCGEILTNGDFSDQTGGDNEKVPTNWTNEGSAIAHGHVDQGNNGLKRTTFRRTGNTGDFKLRQTFSELDSSKQFTLTIDNAKNKPVKVKFLRKNATKACKVTWNSIDGVDGDSAIYGPKTMKRTATFTTEESLWNKPDTIEIWIAGKWIHLDSVSLQLVDCNLLTNGDFSDQTGGDNEKVPTNWTNEGSAIAHGHVDQGNNGLKRNTFRRTGNTGDFKLRQTFDELGQGEQFTLTIDNAKNRPVKVKFLRKNATKACKVTWNSIDGVDGDSAIYGPKTMKRTATFTTLEDWNKPDTIEIWIANKWVRLDSVSLYKV